MFNCFISLGPDVTKNTQYRADVLFNALLQDTDRYLQVIINSNRKQSTWVVTQSYQAHYIRYIYITCGRYEYIQGVSRL